MPTLPCLLVGDSPRRSTGLARIARDLTRHLVADVQAGVLKDLEIVQAGPDDGGGASGAHWTAWPFYGLPAVGDDWGARELSEVWAHCYGDQPGILLSVWDPARCYELLLRGAYPQGQQWWGYFPVDAQTRRGAFGGPAGMAVRQYARVLGYGRWGARVLKGVTGRDIPYLPHGIDLDTFTPEETGAGREEALGILGRRVKASTIVIGCVAANQPRKDLGLWSETIATLLHRGWEIHAWLHTDVAVGPGWAIPQLIEEAGIGRHVTVTTGLSDRQLASLYRCCAATIAPGLGEGFCYPVAESLACGVPAVHGTYAGAAELIPVSAWRIPVRAERLEGPYALVRPVYTAEDLANAVERAVRWQQAEAGNGVVRGYCAGSVAHLGWDQLWPRWRSWIAEGLREL